MAIQQKMIRKKTEMAIVYNFLDYKKNKPFFTKPIVVHVGQPINKTYKIIKNVTYEGKHFLAMNRNEDPRAILLVEATIKDGQLLNISSVPEYIMTDIIKLFKNLIIS
jgi:hypothetical protein